LTSGGFRRGQAGSAPFSLGDGLTPSLTVMLANAKFWSFYCKTWYSEYKKNDCHQRLSGSFIVHQIRFRPVLHSGPHRGSLQHSLRPCSWFKGPYICAEGEGRDGWKGAKGNGRDPLSQIPGSARFWRSCLHSPGTCYGL